MRASTIAVAASLVLAAPVVAGCDRGEDDEDDLEDRIRSPEDELDDVVVFGGELEITIDDVDEAVERLRLLAPGVEDGQIPDDDPDWMKMPQSQINLVRNVVRFEVIRKAADDRELEVSSQDKVEFLADHEQLHRYRPLAENGDGADALRRELHAVGLDEDDVFHLVEDMVLEQKLQTALADEFSDDQLWAVYRQTYDEADVVVVSVPNTPESYEIDRAVDQYDEQIRAYYREHRDRYTTPRRVEATLLESDGGGRAGLEEAAERLGDEAPHEVADDLGLSVRSDVEISPQVDPDVYDAEAGDTGVVTEYARGPYAWHVDEVEEPQTRKLDRPLRREIGSRILRQQEGITPANRQRAQTAREILKEPDAGEPLDEDQISALMDRLEQEGFDVTHSDYFSVHGSGVVPGVGLAESLFEAIGGLDLDDPVTEPHLDRNDVRVARLVDRNHPDRDTFEDEADDFRRDFVDHNKQRFVDQYIQEYKLEQEVNFHFAVVSEHYGTIDRHKARHPGGNEPVGADELAEPRQDAPGTDQRPAPGTEAGGH